MKQVLSLVASAALLAGCAVGSTPSLTPSVGPSPASTAARDASPSPDHRTPPPSPSLRPPASPQPSMPSPPTYVVGELVSVLTEDLRVRSKPEVSDDSVKYEPTLRLGTTVTITAGPVAASGYWWYGVKLQPGQTLNGGVDHGWVAAAARDGTPWVGVADTMGSVFAAHGWPTVDHQGVRLTGSDEMSPTVDWRITVALEGLALVSDGDTETLEAHGSYSIEWVCIGSDDSPIGGHIAKSVRLKGTAHDTVRIPIGPDGRGTGLLVLSPDRSGLGACPPGSDGWSAWSGEWQGNVIDRARSMALEPPPASWDTTF